MDKKGNIGIFDSGFGGLWILRHLRENLPDYNYIFVADQAHVPYGTRSLLEIRDFSEKITEFLVKNDCKIVVIACNTASAASLKYLREKWKDVFFVGMEPAVKPAVENTHTRKVGVLATSATFQGELYNSVVERFAQDVSIYKDTCLGLVEQIEKGNLDGKETFEILNKALTPMLKEGIDTVVLGCTHYPFAIPVIKKITGDNIKVIDPTPAILKQINKIINDNNLKNLLGKDKNLNIYTSGSVDKFENLSPKLLGEIIKIKQLNWDKNSNLIVLE